MADDPGLLRPPSPDGIINSRFIDTGFIQKPLDANPWMYDLLDELFESATAAEQADLMDFFLNFRAPHYGYATMEFGESADNRTREVGAGADPGRGHGATTVS